MANKPVVTLARSASQPALDPKNQQTRAGHTGATAAGQPGTAALLSTAAPIRPRTFPDNATIKIVAAANPKRPGTKAASKWALYDEAKKLSKDGTITVGNVVAAFVAAKWPKRRALSALRWDSGHGFIEVTMPGAQPAK